MRMDVQPIRFVFVLILMCLVLAACSRMETSEHESPLFVVKEYGKYGYIDSTGRVAIACRFDGAKDFSEGLAAVLIDSLYGFVNTNGTVVIQPRFGEAGPFSEGLCAVAFYDSTGLKKGFIKPDGSIAFLHPVEYMFATFSSGRAEMISQSSPCFIDRTGKFAFCSAFPYGSGFRDGVAKFWSGDSTVYVDTNGNVLFGLSGMGHNDFAEGKASVQISGRNCYVDRTGRPVLSFEGGGLVYFDFSCGMARVTRAGWDHVSGYIDTTGRLVVPLQYRNCDDFSDGLAAFIQDGKTGFIDTNGNVVIPPKFDHTDYEGFRDGLCRVSERGEGGYINKRGEYVWKEQSGLAYRKLDLSKWELDTLETNEPRFATKIVGWSNYPRPGTPFAAHSLALYLDTSDVTVADDRYYAHKLYLVNGTNDTLGLVAQDGAIRIVQEAINDKGHWQDIENYINSWCGNSYKRKDLPPLKHWAFPAPIYKGDFRTRLRFKLFLPDSIVYSNTFIGTIHEGQFLRKEDRDHTEIITWTK